MKNGIAVFHIIDKNEESYQNFEDVKDNVYDNLNRELKKEKAKLKWIPQKSFWP